MITLNQLITLYRDIATRHKQVNDFLVVQDFNIEMDKAPVYPLLVVNPVSANLPRTENGYTSFNTTFELQVLDLVNKDNDNRTDVMSDTQQIITDVVNEFNTHPYYIDNSIDTIGDINYEPIRGAYGGDVDGWKISITMEHPVQLSYCSAPILPLAGFDFTPPAVTVIDGVNTFELFPSDTYTCELPTEKSGIQYQRVHPTGETTSYALHDDAWQLVNNPYPAPPSNPEYMQGLINGSINILSNNNSFGNTDRFTDDLGGQVYANNYVIDNLTGIGIYRLNDGISKIWGSCLTFAEDSTQNGYTDWRIPNLEEFLSFTSVGGLLIENNTYWCSTSWKSNTSRAFRYKNIDKQSAVLPKTVLYRCQLIRNHF